MQTLKVCNLCKKFGDLTVLQDINYIAQAGDIVALLGSSGSGKSTFLRCISLLERPDGGVIEVSGVVLNYGASAKSKNTAKLSRQLHGRIGMVFQHFNLWPHLTVLQNLMLAPLHVKKQSKAVVQEKAIALLDKVGMLPKKDCHPAQLSGGQRQRVAIARALIMDPEIMLFDEPTSALDPEMTSEVLKILQLLAQDGMTMLIATHEISFARELASRALFLDHGQVIEQGLADEILHQPQTVRLKKFLLA
jgi:ABC-type histidine transport system ATPase subunit